MELRKSLPVKKGNLQTDFARIMKVCDENSRKSMSKREDSVNAKSGRRALADVSNLKNNSSRTGVDTGSKAVKLHNVKNQCMPRVVAGQCTTGASVSSRKLIMGTSKTVQKIALKLIILKESK
ncbi:hypothetical protein AQUCO_03000316v1 [Aquilegia coerulea]|uniref:Uncharacterized protein n=1 Tax=Aquilegia coerulea TaxID=218851 RepID=A0A2G5D387_AQUCA|nr:hypothetical protein AQUCO_03000316v1 [Aquilegia coerulea]